MVLTVAGILIGLILIGGFVRGWQSQAAPELGLVGGALRPCPDKPNCVSSEPGSDTAHAIRPLDSKHWPALRAALAQAGGVVSGSGDDAHYLHAAFTSRVFRFVDDVEARLDKVAGVIHLRSASRVGHSDLGVNRKRIEALRESLSGANPE